MSKGIEVTKIDLKGAKSKEEVIKKIMDVIAPGIDIEEVCPKKETKIKKLNFKPIKQEELEVEDNTESHITINTVINEECKMQEKGGSSEVTVSVSAFGAGGPRFEPRQGMKVENFFSKRKDKREKKLYKNLLILQSKKWVLNK